MSNPDGLQRSTAINHEKLFLFYAASCRRPHCVKIMSRS